MVSTCRTNSPVTSGTAASGSATASETSATQRQLTNAPHSLVSPADISTQQTFLDQRPNARVVEFPSRSLCFHAAEIEQIEMIGEWKRLFDVLLHQKDRDTACL